LQVNLLKHPIKRKWQETDYTTSINRMVNVRATKSN